MLRLLLIIVGLGLLPGSGLQIHVRGQFSAPIPPVTIDMHHVELADILTELEKQSGLFFSYESSLLKDLPKVTLTAKEESFSYCLKRLFASLPLTYRVTGQYVILKPQPKSYTISGFVRDSASYESLISATVVDRHSGRGTTTNSYGFYSITLPAGPVSLYSSYVGFGSKEISFELTGDTLVDLPLSAAGMIQEIVIRGTDPHSEVLNSQMGNIQLSANQIRHVPVVFGEPDLIKTLQLTPGIASGMEGLTGMYVRGGGGDENLFLLDGIPVYNVNHLGGLFSTFNPDMVKNVDFYKGSFPARYGGRLSSVIDVRLKDGDMQNYHGSFTIGLLAARANIEGPIVKDKTSFNVAFRRTWYDAFTTPIFAIKNRNNQYGFFAGYSFYDLNAKINHIFTPKSRLYANFYMGQDRLRYEEYEWMNHYPIGEKFSWRWGNLVTSLNWNYIFSNKLFSNLNIAYSRYKLKVREEENRLKVIKGETDDFQLNQFTNRHSSGIEDMGYIYNLDYSPVPEHHIKGGVQYLYHTYHPEKKTYNVSSFGNGWRDQTILYRIDQDPVLHAHEWAVFAEDEWTLGERWKINVGARLSNYHVQKEDYLSFQPRLSMRYLIRPGLSVKAGYTKMSQYVHQLSNTYANLPSDIWVPVTAEVKPMESHQYTAGLYYNYRKTYDVSLEGYYKKMNHVIEYQDNASLFPKYTQWDEKISMGTGRSYGVELMVKRGEGHTTGWVAYTLAWSDRIFRDGTVNEGIRFPSKFDNRHKFNATVIHKINDRIDISASWTFATGNRVTIPVDYYLSPDFDPSISTGRPVYGTEYFDGGGISQYYITNGYETILRRNAFKLANYHHLDLSLNIYRPRKNGNMGIWNISLYNVYSRKNPFCIDNISSIVPGELKVSQKGFIPIIPSFSYTYKF